MPLSGIDIAKKLRHDNIDCTIIFITISTEHYLIVIILVITTIL